MGGSMPLPRICGFAEEFFFSHKLSPEEEHAMSSMLGRNRFQKGNRAARSYANLVVLFRMLLFYDALKHHARFWEWIAADWGIIADQRKAIVSKLANFYSDARYAAFNTGEQRLSLLVRLVDEWLMIRPRPELQYSEEVDGATVQATREAWLKIRDYHVDMLMDSKLPASLVGVEPPSKVVTSLWEPDPEVVALLKELKTTRKPKPFFGKTSAPKPASLPDNHTARVEERKRKASLSEGEIDERELAPQRRAPFFDERFFTLNPEREGTELTFNSPADPYKRSKPIGDENIYNILASEAADTFDLINFESPMGEPAEFFKQPVQQPEPEPEPEPTAVVRLEPASVQPSLAATPTHAISSKHTELRAHLLRVSSQIGNQQKGIGMRVEVETTGCVPLPGAFDGRSESQVQVTSGPMAAEERQMYDSRLRNMEARMAELETAHREESTWARAMGRFLYAANEQSIKSLQDAFSAIAILQHTSSTLLDTLEEKEN